MSARTSWPTLNTVSDRQSARNIAHGIREEVKRLRAKVRSALVALQARRKEARAEFRAREAEARAELKRRIAELRAARKTQSAEHRRALRETLAAIDAEINASKAELSDVLPEARSYLRALMVRGENLKSAAAIARGRKGGRKTSETLTQIRDMIVDEMGVDRFKGGVAAKARAYIAKWLRNPKRKGASKSEGYTQFDPHSPYWSPLEQFQHWAEEENHWKDLLSEWAEEESDYEIQHAETSWKRLDAAIRKAEQLLEDAAYCTDPEAYQALESAISEAPTIDSYDGKGAENLAEKVEELSEELTEECAARDTALPFDWDDPKAGKLRAGSIRRMRSRLRKGARKKPAKAASTPTASKQVSEPQARKTAKQRRGVLPGYLLDDERVILAVHQQMDTRGDNMTKLFDLRKETRIPRDRFDAAILSLRKQGRAYLESSQGQAVKLTAPERAAGIEDDGRRLVYFSLR